MQKILKTKRQIISVMQLVFFACQCQLQAGRGPTVYLEWVMSSLLRPCLFNDRVFAAGMRISYSIYNQIRS